MGQKGDPVSAVVMLLNEALQQADEMDAPLLAAKIDDALQCAMSLWPGKQPR